MTNFDFLLSEPQFSTFSDVAVNAEKILTIDAAASVLNCRRAMEFAVKWMYSVDTDLHMPYDATLIILMNSAEFRELIGEDMYRRMDFIRKAGNIAAHGEKKISMEQAELCLENLYYFLDYVAYCYSKNYAKGRFDADLLELTTEEALSFVTEETIDVESLLAENKALKEELTARRAAGQQTYVPTPLNLSEFKTRKIYIDTQLTEAGWVENKTWKHDVPLAGMHNESGVGFIDYVLYDDMLKPLAIIEVKRSCEDRAAGRLQARLYADSLEKQYGRRPVIFLTNGFETWIDDDHYPERKVAAIYARQDLQKLFSLREARTSLTHVAVDKTIAPRQYQVDAVKAACDALDAKNRRRALLVMAPGAERTRTAVALCKVLFEHGWVRNILFLSDTASSVSLAKRCFANLFSDISVTNLCEEKNNLFAQCVCSTYQTMFNRIDEEDDDDRKLFTNGHFDLLICDEAQRSIDTAYREILNYFDAPMLGLTATPKNKLDKNTYAFFEAEGVQRSAQKSM